MRKHTYYKLQLNNLDSDYICILVALDQGVICNDTSRIKYGDCIQELKNKGIHLIDTQNPGHIDVLLDAGVADSQNNFPFRNQILFE